MFSIRVSKNRIIDMHISTFGSIFSRSNILFLQKILTNNIENKNDTVIPNSYPYKEELMNEAELKMQEEKEMKAH